MLTIGISTVGDNFYNTVKKISILNLCDLEINIFVVCQLFGSDEQGLLREISELDCDDKISFYFFDEIGISNSRNRAIQVCQTEYLWFVDDDFSFDESEIKCLVSDLFQHSPDVMLVKIRSMEDPFKFYKNYLKHPIGYNKNKLFLLKASSIEIVIKIEFVKRSGVRFNTQLGLGTLYPCCEENVFLLDLVDSGATVFYSNVGPIYHTTLLELREPISKGHYFARGYLASKFNFILFNLLIFRWALREHPKIKFFQRLKYLFYGKDIFK